MATPIPACFAPAGWFCSPVASVLQCPANMYCPGGYLPPRACPVGKYAQEGSIYLTDCGDGANVYFGTVVAVILCVFLVIFCVYCVFDWYEFQGTYQVVYLPQAKCLPPRCCPVPSAPDWGSNLPHAKCPTPRCCPAPSAPDYVYYEEARQCHVNQAIPPMWG